MQRLCLQNILKLDCCIGIIGGKPKHSLYFVGFQGEKPDPEDLSALSKQQFIPLKLPMNERKCTSNPNPEVLPPRVPQMSSCCIWTLTTASLWRTCRRSTFLWRWV